MLSQNTLSTLENLIDVEKLPKNFIETIQHYYMPVAEDLTRMSDHQKSQNNSPFFLGIQGSQGSGKTTLALFIQQILEVEYNKRCTLLSLDDFYLTKQERQQLSKRIHPLLSTRGVPGTHDTALLSNTLDKLLHLAAPCTTDPIVTIPRFDKAVDDRAKKSQWDSVNQTQDIIILEGWCVGISAQSKNELKKPINQLETEEDPQGIWRNYVNQQIAEHYQTIYDLFNGLLVLASPSFDCVYHWRLEQEKKLIAKRALDNTIANETFNAQGIKRFIAHYQRITEHGFNTMTNKADWVLKLETDHSISRLKRKNT